MWVQSSGKEECWRQEIRNDSCVGVTSLKALLRNLDSYPVSSGEPVKGLKQGDASTIFTFRKRTLTGCERLIILSRGGIKVIWATFREHLN